MQELLTNKYFIWGGFNLLVLAMLAAIPFRMGWLDLYASSESVISLEGILIGFMQINLLLMIFNLIPFPPLDGSRILAWLLPPKWARMMDRLEQYGGAGLILVLYLLSKLGILGMIIIPLMDLMILALLVY